jgi:hypothetical protein
MSLLSQEKSEMKHRLRPYLAICFIIIGLGAPGPAAAREIILTPGENYTADGLSVRCLAPPEAASIVLNECQYWDRFNAVCLFEKKRHRYGKLECVEECQHWDKFNEVCHYATSCRFHPSQHSFVRTSCSHFDETGNTCKRTRQEILGK